jgi:hypothetical protein
MAGRVDTGKIGGRWIQAGKPAMNRNLRSLVLLLTCAAIFLTLSCCDQPMTGVYINVTLKTIQLTLSERDEATHAEKPVDQFTIGPQQSYAAQLHWDASILAKDSDGTLLWEQKVDRSNNESTYLNASPPLSAWFIVDDEGCYPIPASIREHWRDHLAEIRRQKPQ